MLKPKENHTMALRNLRQKASQAAEKGLDNTGGTLEESLDSAEELLEELRALKRRAEGGARGTFSRAANGLEDFAEDTGRKLRHAYEAGAETLEDAADTSRQTVQENPLLAVAGAFAGGILLGMLMRK
jgi:ElaB/YqjD/DUF883 family membrane-anchored ribosome-binding protein